LVAVTLAAVVAEMCAAADRQADSAVPAKRMIETAAHAYKATLTNYDAGNATLESVFNWSDRWMTAAASVTVSQAAHEAAAKSHIARMQKLQNRVKAATDSGSRGNADMAAADYYVAQAQWRLEGIKQRFEYVGLLRQGVVPLAEDRRAFKP
jgi:hypothetical protein